MSVMLVDVLQRCKNQYTTYGMKIMDVWIDRDTDRQMRVDLLYNYGCPQVS